MGHGNPCQEGDTRTLRALARAGGCCEKDRQSRRHIEASRIWYKDGYEGHVEGE